MRRFDNLVANMTNSQENHQRPHSQNGNPRPASFGTRRVTNDAVTTMTFTATI
jgi:hypothetical protein